MESLGYYECAEMRDHLCAIWQRVRRATFGPSGALGGRRLWFLAGGRGGCDAVSSPGTWNAFGIIS
jgi:hypothetical protein